jgi:hypothetical protein
MRNYYTDRKSTIYWGTKNTWLSSAGDLKFVAAASHLSSQNKSLTKSQVYVLIKIKIRVDRPLRWEVRTVQGFKYVRYSHFYRPCKVRLFRKMSPVSEWVQYSCCLIIISLWEVVVERAKLISAVVATEATATVGDSRGSDGDRSFSCLCWSCSLQTQV